MNKEEREKIVEDIFGLEVWEQDNLPLWIGELVEKIYDSGYRKTS